MIRDANEADIPQILAMFDAYLDEQLVYGGGVLAGPRSRETCRIALQMLIDGDVDGCLLVADGADKKTLVGFSMLRVDTASVEHTHSKIATSIISYVAPEQRRMGISREFLKRKLEYARISGCAAVLSSTRRANKAASGLLVDAGFAANETVYMHRLGAK